jgi:hypothetical protein
MSLIITNPMLSGRSLKAMVISRKPDGTFTHEPSTDADVAIGDGQTTIIHIPLGARLVLREAADPPLVAPMTVNPAVTGKPAAPAPTPTPTPTPTPAPETRPPGPVSV